MHITYGISFNLNCRITLAYYYYYSSPILTHKKTEANRVSLLSRVNAGPKVCLGKSWVYASLLPSISFYAGCRAPQIGLKKIVRRKTFRHCSNSKVQRHHLVVVGSTFQQEKAVSITFICLMQRWCVWFQNIELGSQSVQNCILSTTEAAFDNKESWNAQHIPEMGSFMHMHLHMCNYWEQPILIWIITECQIRNSWSTMDVRWHSNPIELLRGYLLILLFSCFVASPLHSERTTKTSPQNSLWISLACDLGHMVVAGRTWPESLPFSPSGWSMSWKMKGTMQVYQTHN